MVAAEDVRDSESTGSSVAWRHPVPWTSLGWVTARGEDPGEVAHLVGTLHTAAPVGGYTVPQSAAPTVAERMGGGEPRDWCWWWRESAPWSVPGVSILEANDSRINELLAHSSSAYMMGGDERVRRWMGVVDGTELLAVGGATVEKSGAWHLVSVCTHPDQRGRGLARDVCRALMAEALAGGAPVVVLEMYSDNEPARRIYGALGFVEEARFQSCVLEPGLMLPA